MVVNSIVSGGGTLTQLVTVTTTSTALYVTLRDNVLAAQEGKGTLNVVKGSEMTVYYRTGSLNITGDIEMIGFDDNGYQICLVNGNGTINITGGGDR